MLLNKTLKALLPLVALVTPSLAAFGLTESGNSWTVDTNAGLVFTGKPSVQLCCHDVEMPRC